MQIDGKLLVDLVRAAAWPVVLLIGLFLLRRPLVELVAQIARRAQKFSIYNVSIELSTLPALESSWSIGSSDVRRLTSSQIFDSGSETLFQEMLKPGPADYALVDLGGGQEWLTSRLYVFALILGRVRSVRAFVFLEGIGEGRRKFLGVATPDEIVRCLARRYPWFEEACFRTVTAQQYSVVWPDVEGGPMFSNSTSLFDTADDIRLRDFVRDFLQIIQRATAPPAHELDSYLELATQPQTWERAHWITGERLERDLSGLDRDWYLASADKSRTALVEGVLRRSANFVSLIDDDHRFSGLVDRAALLESVWRESLAERDKTTETKFR